MAYIILGVCTFPFYFFFPDWFEDRTSWNTEDEIHHDGALAFEVHILKHHLTRSRVHQPLHHRAPASSPKTTRHTRPPRR